ncbi:transcription elongation factor GreA [Mycoplasma wenyonii str. Massachusetts]|uniref:Transcription elongation factor GreA n=1 Tax=Mycoplasma wenyonii (strain Massachusetts) TaxID=1197325 RepID=I6Z6G5_MYCWM|nr:transcription elongation factor GreA [Mycoplasma wenyonii]AFN65183.1 transcription elongation factor GreA [Mycoplasma wenyonii str. Massachusetts]
MSTNYLTEEKLAEIKSQLNKLIDVERPQVLEELKYARSLGDLSENADYDSAKMRQEQLEKKISELEAILKNYEIIGKEGKKGGEDQKVVKIGSKVRVFHSLSNKEYTYEILGSLDADPAQFKISNESPIAKAILGKPVGGTHTVEGMRKSCYVKILEIF